MGELPTSLRSRAIRIDDLTVDARIGVYAHEVGRTQPLVLTIWLEVTPAATDDLSATIDYCEIRDIAIEIGRSPLKLIETFADRMAERCLEYPLVHSAQVQVAKPQAIAPALASVCVTLRR
ncbi:dihydroneopterin aldolase [Sphingobium sp. EP60837]|uniref:dihydroneopterin aldolase n=1 Tax=Sphingobium sp. EP60837 TaxID=1855519 RepID=UPI0007DCEC1A|nr:dihydroneopterin aldolase [Sphingobium sp. EP60837]ANI80210.1 Dihydroneopterin aldolase [Sphingobium sp. EP60837]